jgi:hypothetical protein
LNFWNARKKGRAPASYPGTAEADRSRPVVVASGRQQAGEIDRRIRIGDA